MKPKCKVENCQNERELYADGDEDVLSEYCAFHGESHMQPNNKTVEEREEQFRKEFDKLGLKPPKNSMPNLERELIIDFWRKALSERDKKWQKILADKEKHWKLRERLVIKEVREEILNQLSSQSLHAEVIRETLGHGHHYSTMPVVAGIVGKLKEKLTPQPMKQELQKEEGKKILDACCGGRMFWFNKNHPDALFIDIREEQDFQTGKGVDNRHRAIRPDKVMDFRKMDLPDNTFSLVVFDPPHLKIGRKSYFAQIYGSLEDTWQEDIRKGFAECFRVLKKDGVLIFKWNESDIPLREILALTPVEPLFGHRSGKAQKTHWITFMNL